MSPFNYRFIANGYTSKSIVPNSVQSLDSRIERNKILLSRFKISIGIKDKSKILWFILLLILLENFPTYLLTDLLRIVL